MKRHRLAKYGFALFVLLLWLVVAATALEAWARMVGERRDGGAARVEARLYNDPATAARNAKTIARFAEAPPVTGTDFEARAAFLDGTESFRENYVATREEMVLRCNSTGVVTAIYGPGPHAPPEIRALAEQIRPGLSLPGCLPSWQQYDAENALAAAFSGERQLRDYPIPQEDGADYVMQFVFMPDVAAASPAAEVGVFIRPSMWLELWRSFRPNVAHDDIHTFSTNRHGFRDDEVELPKPPGRFRVVCFGGSTTAEGPTNQLTYPKMLDVMLKNRYGDDRIEVVNAGIFAILSHDEVERFPDIVALEPDLVVYYNFVNDLPTFFEKFPTGRRVLGRSAFVYHYLNSCLLPSRQGLTAILEQTTLHNLGRMREMAKQAGVAMAFCGFAHPNHAVLPDDEQDFFDQRINRMMWGRQINMSSYVRIVRLFNTLLEERCEEWDALYIPVPEHLSGGADVFTDICHIQVWGMEVKAYSVFDHIVPFIDFRVGMEPS